MSRRGDLIDKDQKDKDKLLKNLFQALIKNKADSQKEEKDELVSACKEDKFEVVQKLIKNKADIYDKKYQADPLLIVAARHSAKRVTLALILAKANPNVLSSGEQKSASRKGETAVGVAASNDLKDERNFAIIKCLVNNKADLNIGIDPPLFGAVINDNFEVFQYLVEQKADVNLQNQQQRTVLEWALDWGCRELFIKICEKYTPTVSVPGLLHDVVQKEDIQVLELLLKIKADPNILDSSGKTSLDYAMQQQHFVLIRALLRAPIKPLPNKKKATPLHLAAEYGMHEIVKELIKEKCDVNCLDKTGYTPLMEAVRLEAIDTNQTPKEGRTKVIETLMVLPTTKYLLDAGAIVDLASNLGETALMVAAGTHNLAYIKLLLECKADLAHKNHLGQTALHKAAKYGRYSVFGYLVNSKADINAKDLNGQTATEYFSKQVDPKISFRDKKSAITSLSIIKNISQARAYRETSTERDPKTDKIPEKIGITIGKKHKNKKKKIKKPTVLVFSRAQKPIEEKLSKAVSVNVERDKLIKNDELPTTGDESEVFSIAEKNETNKQFPLRLDLVSSDRNPKPDPADKNKTQKIFPLRLDLLGASQKPEGSPSPKKEDNLVHSQEDLQPGENQIEGNSLVEQLNENKKEDSKGEVTQEVSEPGMNKISVSNNPFTTFSDGSSSVEGRNPQISNITPNLLQ